MAKELLFNKVKERKVVAFDLLGKKHKRRINDFKFRPGAYGVLRSGSKVLVQKHPLIREYGFPGGGVGIDESIKVALAREYKEETGLTIKAGKILGIDEDYFTSDGQDAHGIFIYYEVKKVGGKILSKGNGSDTSEVKFIEIDELTKENSLRAEWKFIKEYKKLIKTDSLNCKSEELRR